MQMPFWDGVLGLIAQTFAGTPIAYDPDSNLMRILLRLIFVDGGGSQQELFNMNSETFHCLLIFIPLTDNWTATIGLNKLMTKTVTADIEIADIFSRLNSRAPFEGASIAQFFLHLLMI